MRVRALLPFPSAANAVFGGKGYSHRERSLSGVCAAFSVHDEDCFSCQPMYDTPSGLAVSSKSLEHAHLVYTYRGLGRLVSPAASAVPGWLLRKCQQRLGRRSFLLRRSNPNIYTPKFASACPPTKGLLCAAPRRESDLQETNRLLFVPSPPPTSRQQPFRPPPQSLHRPSTAQV